MHMSDFLMYEDSLTTSCPKKPCRLNIRVLKRSSRPRTSFLTLSTAIIFLGLDGFWIDQLLCKQLRPIKFDSRCSLFLLQPKIWSTHSNQTPPTKKAYTKL